MRFDSARVTAVTTPEFSWSEDFAIAMDQRDPLRGFQTSASCFLKLPMGKIAYISRGHCSDFSPKTAAEYIQQELKDWAELGVEGHF